MSLGKVVAVLNEGDSFGEIAQYKIDARRTASCVALGDTVLEIVRRFNTGDAMADLSMPQLGIEIDEIVDEVGESDDDSGDNVGNSVGEQPIKSPPAAGQHDHEDVFAAEKRDAHHDHDR